MHTLYVHSGGHLQIQHRDYFEYGSGNPSAYAIKNHQNIIMAIERDPTLRDRIAVVTPTLQFGGIASNYAASLSRTVLGTGLVAADHTRMRQWNEFGLPFEPEPFALDGAPSDAAIVGKGLARVLGLCTLLPPNECAAQSAAAPNGNDRDLPEDVAQLLGRDDLAGKRSSAALDTPTIEVLASSARGAPNVVSVQVMRAELQGFKELDEVFLVLQLQRAQQLLYGRDAALVTSIIVQLRRSEDLAEAAERIEHVLESLGTSEPLRILDFRQLNPFFVQTVQMFNAIFGFIFALIGAIVLFTVSNTMNTAVLERTVEIGTVRALGLRQAGVRRLFLVEGSMLGVVGAVCGALLAIVLSLIVNRMGITWIPPGSSEPLPLLLVVWGETTMIAGTTLGLIAIAAASAWWPAYRASRLKIVDALRHA